MKPQEFFGPFLKGKGASKDGEFHHIYKTLQKRHISDLIHYLTIQGQPGLVNVNKLIKGLDLPKGSQPLSQENIPAQEKINKVTEELKEKQKKNPQTQVPTAVI